MTRAGLAEQMRLELSATPEEIISGIWTTDEISERPALEGSSDYHLMREGDLLIVDAYRDDMALVLQSGDQLMLICGCRYAGLLNTVTHVKRPFEGSIAVIAGGLHLTCSTDDDVRHVGEVLGRCRHSSPSTQPLSR